MLRRRGALVLTKPRLKRAALGGVLRSERVALPPRGVAVLELLLAHCQLHVRRALLELHLQLAVPHAAPTQLELQLYVRRRAEIVQRLVLRLNHSLLLREDVLLELHLIHQTIRRRDRALRRAALLVRTSSLSPDRRLELGDASRRRLDDGARRAKKRVKRAGVALR